MFQTLFHELFTELGAEMVCLCLLTSLITEKYAMQDMWRQNRSVQVRRLRRRVIGTR